MSDNKYNQIKKNNLSETVSEKIEEMILEGSIKIGEKLPSENKLSDLFGVSRNIVREALVSLKERGLITIKTAKGSYVVKPKKNILGDAVNRLVKLSDIDNNNIYEIRSALEVSAAGLAALRANKEDIENLDTIIYKMKNVLHLDDWISSELKFHTAIAIITKNPLFYVFISQLVDSFEDLFVEFYSENERKEVIKDHIKVVEAIKEGNKEEAEKSMLNHLEKSNQVIKEQIK